MEDAVLGRLNKHLYNRSADRCMKMLQTRAPTSSYNNNNDHLASNIPINKHSRMITKQPQKVRIIHIIPPEIIQTDKANFRELVQSLTGRSSSATNTVIKKHQTPQLVTSSDLHMSYLLGFSGSNTNSSHTKLISPNMKLLNDLYDDHHEKNNLDIVASDHHEISNDVWNYDSKFGVRNAKVKEEETILLVQAPDDTEWGIMKEKLDNGFCTDEFLELDEWLSQDVKLPNLMPNAGSANWGIDLLLGEL